MEGSPRLHDEVEEVRRRQDMELQSVMREVEEERARVVREGEQRLEALYREQEEEVAGLVLDWQRREGQMRREGGRGGVVDEAELRQEGGNQESRIVELVNIEIPAQRISETAAEAARSDGGQEVEEAGGGRGEDEGEGGGRDRRWFEGTLAPLIIVALLFRIIFI